MAKLQKVKTDVLSSDVWKHWDKTGRQEFVKRCAGFLKNGATGLSGISSPINNCVNQLIDKGIKGLLKRESVVLTLQELVAIHSDAAIIICDVLNAQDAITSHIEAEDAKDRSNFAYFVKECEKFLTDKPLKERLEIETLQEVGILKNKTFYSKFIKIKTKLYYKQKKFNLFREECEGFAKLQTELNKDFTDDTDIKSFITSIHSLIGSFNLDPNRVLDVILESFENRTHASHIFVPLIKSYIKDPNIIKEVLCIKLAFLKNSTDQDVSASFYILTAYLLQHDLVSFNTIYPVLTPDDKVMQKHQEKTLEEANEYVRKLQVISTNSKEKEENKDEPEKIEDTFTKNQKLRLCEALLLIGDWKHAKTLMGILPDHYVVGYEPVASALCQLLHTIIEPIYAKKYSLGPDLQRDPVEKHPNPLAPKQVSSFEDMKQDVIPMLLSLGLAIQVDSMLITKLTRLFKITLQDGTSSPLYHDIISILDVTMFPALSYLECNCCIAEEIWTVVKNYPYQIRYCLYARWKNESYQTYPDLIKRRGDSEKQIKNIMKRVSKDNVKPIGRLLGKVTHSCPGFLFDYVLLQIQVYNNLINPVVDSLKYLTSLSYDVLGYCLIECLASADKKRVKHDSMSISAWLQSLSCFSGAVYKKYSIELTGLLQYVANQLKAQRSLDLIILKEVVQKMAGIEPNEDSTMDQLKALSGGDLLKNEAGYFSQIRNTKKSSTRLKEALGDSDLAVALCLLMSQQNYCVIYRETQKSHLKFVGMLSDHCQDTLVQFGTFLGATLTVEEYIKKFPTIQSMLLDYHIPVEVAFFLARPMLNHSINQKYDQIRKMDPNYKKMASSMKNQKYCEAVQEVMSPMYSSLLPLHSAKTWEDITPQFLATFWSLTMHDLYVPDDIYSQVITKTKVLADAVDNSNTKGKKEQERHLSLVDKLVDERKKQTEHVEKVLHRLKQEKDSWFLLKAGKSAKAESITRFLQLCLFPRCTFSQIDAVYCAEFVHTIHMLKTPNFSTLLCYDRLFCDVTYSIISCTEYEAFRYGRFLYAVLDTVMKWHKSKDVFEKECSNFPGFMTKYRVSNHTADNLDNVGYENYRHVCHKWHYKLAKAVVCCLESKDYIQIRNSLIILIKIINFFPVLIKLAQFLEKRIEQVRDEEKNNRQDLFTLAISYLGLLKQRLNGGHVMKETDFHMPVDKSGKVNDASVKDTAKQNGETKDKVSKDEKNDESRTVKMESQEKVDSRDEKHTSKEDKRVVYEFEKAMRKDKDFEDKSKKPIEDRYNMEMSPREERYSVERKDRFYEERPIYKEVSKIEPENERDGKRRKVESFDDRKAMIQTTESYVEKRERSSKSTKEHREKISLEDDKEMKKERRVARKRDRLEEGSQQEAVTKRRRDEDKAKLLGSAEKVEQITVITREKHRRKESRDARDSRDISPQYMTKERSHERSESREKHRRSNDNKRRQLAAVSTPQPSPPVTSESTASADMPQQPGNMPRNTATVHPYSVNVDGRTIATRQAAALYGQQQLGQAGIYYHTQYNNPGQTSVMSNTFPVHPDVRFKRLPFYDILADLIKPSTLVPSTNQRMQEQAFYFHLTPGQATDIASSRDIRPGVKCDYVKQVQLRFCLLETSCEQDDTFPPQVAVKVNNKMCPLPNPIPTNKPGVEPKRPPRPVNITQMIKLSPTVPNRITVSWATDFTRGYALTVALVHKLTSGDLLNRLQKKGAKHADHTRAVIKEKLTDDGDEIATTSLRVSLMCPLGKMRMSTPCRPQTCGHLQCFDASLFLQMNERKPTWSCPVCDKPALYDNLIIDGYFQEVLSSSLLLDCNEIQLMKDGSWTAQTEKKPKVEKINPVPTSIAIDDSIEIIEDNVEIVSAVDTVDSARSDPEKKNNVVDLTISDSDDDEPLAKRRPPPKPDSTIKLNENSNISSSSSSQQRSTTTPGPSSVSSSGYPVSPGVINLDSPSPPPQSQSSCMMTSAAPLNGSNGTSQPFASAPGSMPFLDIENEASPNINFSQGF